MRPLRTTILWIAAILAVLPMGGHAQGKKQLSYEQIYRNAEPRILQTLPTASGWSDDAHYILSKGRGGSMVLVDAATGKEAPYRDLSQYKSIADSSISLNAPASSTEDYAVLAYLKEGDIYVLNTRERIFKRLTTTEPEEKLPTVSPDGKMVAFTRRNDLFAIDIATGKETRFTTDGSDAIYNGWASWLYMEEILGRKTQYRAFWWSPDSKQIAFFRFDDSRVPLFPLFKADGPHGSLEQTRYPKPGDPNPAVRVGVAAPAGGKVVWADFEPNADQYFGTPFWTPDGRRLLVQWMNRGQDNLKLLAVDPSTGKKKELYDERQTSWVDWLDEVRFVKDGFILKSDKSGWMHLYLHGADGALKRQLTSGDWSVEDVQAVDEAAGRVYFTARKENSTRIDLYSVGLDGKNMQRLTFGEFSHSVKASPTGKFFVTTYSNICTPSRMALCDNSGKVLRELGDSKAPGFSDYELATSELFRVPTPDGYALPVAWTLPLNFDPAKKYPVLITVYGGPGAGTVYDRWGGIAGQWLAKEGMIQVAMDHRGSGHFGKKGAALMHRCLGKWEMNDYIEVVKWLRTQPFVDPTRVGITGGSYGGYVTCMALTAGAGYFTHGLALFSVVDWKLYDSHYVERYMDTPAENPEGYKEGSALTHADKYKGMIRIVHGSLDDNVLMQNSLQLIDRLQDLGKHFEFMIYPNQRHGWGGPKATHLRNESNRFYYRDLLEKPYPAELFAQPAMARPF